MASLSQAYFTVTPGLHIGFRINDYLIEGFMWAYRHPKAIFWIDGRPTTGGIIWETRTFEIS